MNNPSENPPNIPEARELAQLQARMLQSAQNVNQDGSFELGWAIALLCFGFVPYFNAVLTRSHWFSAWTAWAGFLPLLCAAFAPYAIPKLIKRFITWPRTGYVVQHNELKLGQLVMLMVFGCALGGSVSLLLTLVVGVLERHGQGGAQNELRHLALKAIGLVVCALLTVWLGRKVIRKRSPLPTAYDAAALTQGLRQTASGRKRLRVVKFTILGALVGLPLIVFGLVFGLMNWGTSLMRHPEIHWSELGLPGFLVAVNALLYFMASGMVLRPQRWKWFVMPLMLVVPILVAPAIPYPATRPELVRLFDPVPPVMLCLGAVWLLSGAITLVLFLRHNPLPAAETL